MTNQVSYYLKLEITFVFLGCDKNNNQKINKKIENKKIKTKEEEEKIE